MSIEKSKLLSSPLESPNQPTFYFLNRSDSSNARAAVEKERSKSIGSYGSNDESKSRNNSLHSKNKLELTDQPKGLQKEFGSNIKSQVVNEDGLIDINNSNNNNNQSSFIGGIVNSFGNLFSKRSDHAYANLNNISRQFVRKVPVKVEPKVYFANERTFLAWLHMSVTLASISVAIIAFGESNEWSQIYGLLLLPVAIAFCCYSLYTYIKRSTMIRRRDPGPYGDTIGPVILAVMLALTILINFCVKLYDIST